MKKRKKQNRIIVISVVILLAMLLNCIPMEIFADETDDYVVITKNEKTAEKIESTYKVSSEESVDGANNILSGELTASQADKIENMKNVECVERDFTSEIEETNISPDVKPACENWEAKMISATDIKQLGDKVKIAVIDSGIDYTENFDVVERVDFIKDRESTLLFDDTCGHGTSVASIIAGRGKDSDVEGLSQKAEIYSAKILNAKQQAPVSRVVKAIYWAIDKDVDIINISFGTKKYSEALEKAVNDAVAKGILVVASVGNNGKKGIDYPAKFKSVLSVGSVNAKGKVSSFSSKGNKVDVVAPGEAITAQANFGEDLVLSGSSLATPYVTSIAADLWSRDKSKSAEFIKQLIIDSSKKIKSNNGRIDNLIDYKSANANYQRAYEKYDENNIKQDLPSTISTNKSKAKDCSKNVVKASWRHQIHQKYTANCVMKKGAAYSDLYESTIDGAGGKHLIFHGFSGKEFANSNTNYVAAYRYLYKVANLYGKGKHFKKAKESDKKGLTGKQVKEINNFLRKLNRGKLTYVKGFPKWKKKNKKSFVIGIAMHTATDTFAHSTFHMSLAGNIYRYGHHDFNGACCDNCCDNPDFIPNRAKMAIDTEKNIVARYKGKRKGVNLGEDFFSKKMLNPNNYVDFRINMLGTFARNAGVKKKEILNCFDAISTFEIAPPDDNPEI